MAKKYEQARHLQERSKAQLEEENNDSTCKRIFRLEAGSDEKEQVSNIQLCEYSR